VLTSPRPEKIFHSPKTKLAFISTGASMTTTPNSTHTLLELPDAAVMQYIGAFDIGCIVLATDGRACHVGAGDLETALAEVKRQCLVGIWWSKVDLIGRLAAAVSRHLAGAGAGLDAKAVCGVVEKMATKLGIGLTPHVVMMRRARAATQRLKGEVEAEQLKGALKFFNAEFSRRRREAEARGEVFMGYATAVTRLRSAIALEAARRYGEKASNATLIERVFGGRAAY
jgi:hypothetical protein